MRSVGKYVHPLGMLLLLILLLLPLDLLAATGQIKGRVTDRETGEPVLGASVQIVGTGQGDMTDIDGRFEILRVDIGAYSLKISHIDYANVEVTGVQVSEQLTTEQNVELSKDVTDLGKTIQVVATREIIDKFVTANETRLTQQAIKARPVQNVDALLEQVAGVQTNSSGEVFIRGGRANEVSYIVDGVEMGSNLSTSGSASTSLSLVSGSIQEIQIIKDGFDPEYGNALSGIVNIKTQTGNKDLTRINMQYITDDLRTSDLNKYSRNYDYARFSISGPDPILKNRILPAFGLNFLKEQEFTYYLYAEATRDDDIYQISEFDTPVTESNTQNTSVLGLFSVPERARNSTYVIANLKFRPKPNLNFILSYKNSRLKYQRLFLNWPFRYTPSTLPIQEQNWRSLSLEVAQSVADNTTYELHLSYFHQFESFKPGDPNNPGRTLDPDDFMLQGEWEDFTDRNDNGVYDAPEPIINIFPDTAIYGVNVTGPAYTGSEFNLEANNQGGEFTFSDFRFNDNGFVDALEGEPFIDLNGNGVWDAGDLLTDKNGNGVLDQDRQSNINNRDPEPFIDGDVVLGEPFTDVDGDDLYSRGIDLFVRSTDPTINQDLNHNGVYDGPGSTWSPGIPYEDRNRNGIYDAPNFRWDPGEAFTDVNGNAKWDGGGSSNFLNPGQYDINATWNERTTSRYRGEMKIFHQAGNHELKLGGALIFEDFEYLDIQRPYLEYTGRADGGPFPTRGAFRDVFEYKPWRGTVYFRDKLEYGSMIASLGFRWDFFVQDTDRLVEVARNDDLGSGLIKGDRQKFSPRIGFSYPISDKAKVFFNYGHFFQLPSYVYMFSRNTSSVDQNDIVGNYNLDYQKTIQYSFGVKYALTENYALEVSGYFKDEFDKINSQSVLVGGLTRQQYRNSDYGRSRGFELTLDKRGGGYVTGQLSYTYAFAFGKASETNEAFQDQFELSREPLDEAPLNNDIRHSFKAAVSIYIPSTVKPELFGLPLFNGWSLTVESIVESGRPFTPTSTYPGITVTGSESIERNSLRYPSTAVFDARFAKEFSFVGLNCEAILWVENIFDSRNVDFVYDNTGRPDTQTTETIGSENVVKGGTDFAADPFNWDYGRQIRLGLELTL